MGFDKDTFNQQDLRDPTVRACIILTLLVNSLESGTTQSVIDTYLGTLAEIAPNVPGTANPDRFVQVDIRVGDYLSPETQARIDDERAAMFLEEHPIPDNPSWLTELEDDDD